MKKIIVVMMAVAMMAAVAVAAYAQEKVPVRQDPRAAKPPMPVQMLMDMMRQKATSMETLPDGSVIILKGAKLIKYDKDLNLVKAIEVPAEALPEAGMPCPMCGQAIPEGGVRK